MSAARQETPQLQYALHYARLGWSVVPSHKAIRLQDGTQACTCSQGAACVSKGKHPAINWTEFQSRRAHENQITEWFSGRYADYGVGIITGKISGFFVVDVDCGPGKQGAETIDNLQFINDDLPHTVEARTGGGGRHVLLKHPGDGTWIATTKNILGPGVDIRGDGGFIVAAPSMHESGRFYLWHENGHPKNTEIADAPAWVVDMASGTAPSQSDGTPRAAPTGTGEIIRDAWGRVTDGRERHMIGIICGAMASLKRKTGDLPTAEEIFEEAWPSYERTTRARGASLEADQRGETLMRQRIEHSLRRAASGKLELRNAVPPPSAQLMSLAPPVIEGEAYDLETGEILPPQPTTLTATPFQASELVGLPPRQWVYGHFLIRRFLAVLGAPGGTGKTAYAMLVGVAVALNEDYLREGIHEAGNVWIYNLEDPRDELLRRLSALVIHHNIDARRLEGHLFLDSGRERPLVVAQIESDGTIIALPIVDELVVELKRRQVRLLIVDPFVKSHRLEENRNDHIDFAATLWSKVADAADCAILLVHHFRKGGVSGDAAAFRGASAMIDAARAAVSLATMSEDEASKLGVDDGERRFYIRCDNAKLNLAPPPDETVWLKLCSVPLNNAPPLKPEAGDKVQAVERWEPASAWDGLSHSMISRILDKLTIGPEPEEQYTLSKRGKDSSRWAGHVVVEIGCKTEGQAGAILRKWASEGLLQEAEYYSRKGKRKAAGLTVNAVLVAKMRQSDEH